MRRRIVCTLLIIGLAVGVLSIPSAEGEDLLLTGTFQNDFYVISGANNQILKRIPLSGPGHPRAIVPHPDKRTAFVITNRWESIAVVDFDAGREVGRIDLSTPGERVKAVDMTIHPQGDRLYVYEVPVGLGIDRYEVRPTRIKVFDLARRWAVQTFEVPRQLSVIAFSPDGSRLYGLGLSVYIMDPQTGKVLETIPIESDVTGIGAVDVLDFWPNFDHTNIISTPYFAEDKINGKFVVGLANLDLATGRLETIELGTLDTIRIMFNSVVSPDRKKAYVVYTHLLKVDLEKKMVEKKIDIDHTYYMDHISSDGTKVYLAGTQRDIAIYDAETLDKIGSIELPGDQALAVLRVVRR